MQNIRREMCKQIFESTIYFQDEVYTRTCDLQSVEAVFGADLYCHSKCIKHYLRKYETALKNATQNESAPSEKRNEFQLILKEIDTGLNEGKGYALSDISIYANHFLKSPEHEFTNREIRLLLYSYYGETLCFTVPKEKNKSSSMTPLVSLVIKLLLIALYLMKMDLW